MPIINWDDSQLKYVKRTVIKSAFAQAYFYGSFPQHLNCSIHAYDTLESFEVVWTNLENYLGVFEQAFSHFDLILDNRSSKTQVRIDLTPASMLIGDWIIIYLNRHPIC